MKSLLRLRSFTLRCLPVAVFLPMVAMAQSEGISARPQLLRNVSIQSDKASGQSQGSTTLPSSDKKFVREAAEGGLAEVEFGKLAMERASSDEVKKFGQRMVHDHSKANDELKQIAGTKGLDLPEALSAKDKALKERLSKLSGPSFDRAYIENMVKDHKKDVADFAQESKNGEDTDVKQFAAKTLPTLKDHLREAEGIAPATKKTSPGGGLE